MSVPEHLGLRTYLNPVYQKSFPDPFVLKFGGEYFAYCTGFGDDGNVFGVLRSKDLVTWIEVGSAMEPLESRPPYYWAPEVTYSNGKFYLYYSAGNETLMEIRVAVSDRPDGGFADIGRPLTNQDFAIDAHVFIDDDGSKYLFYATDFLDHTHIGTGTVVDRMIDWFTLEGSPKPVTRARYDWQVYDPERKEKGGVRWHTVEGPAVIKRKGLYYEMFSGGNWQNTTYGVSFATTHQIAGDGEWQQFSDDEKTLPILRTLPDKVVGPGHNCIVAGPNNRELYCVYHRWTDAGRVMAIDRMDFAGERIFVVGATHTPQPAPFEPDLVDSSKWIREGDWTSHEGTITSPNAGRSTITVPDLPSSFLCELTLACSEALTDDGRIEVELKSNGSAVCLTFHPIANVMRIEVPADSTGFPLICKLPEDFNWIAVHTLRIEADHRRLKIGLDGCAMPKVNTFLSATVSSLSIVTENQSATISSFMLTEGFEELFTEPDALTDNGWEFTGDADFQIETGELFIEAKGAFELKKHRELPACEYAANLRSMEGENSGEFGLVLRDADETAILRVIIDNNNSQIIINDETRTLAAEVSLSTYHQLRVIKDGSRAFCYFDDVLLDIVAIRDTATTASVIGKDVRLAVEMIRLTSIRSIRQV
jgi:GH43 family beta-xylosidase